MDSGCSGPCPVLKSQSYGVANKCNLKQFQPEDIDSWASTLPGNMQVTYK